MKYLYSCSLVVHLFPDRSLGSHHFSFSKWRQLQMKFLVFWQFVNEKLDILIREVNIIRISHFPS